MYKHLIGTESKELLTSFLETIKNARVYHNINIVLQYKRQHSFLSAVLLSMDMHVIIVSYK